MTGMAGRMAGAFINSKLTPLFIGASILLGAFSVWKLPREEEPQIIVPIIDVFVRMPGAPAREVEERVTKPMEKLLWEIPGVEYIYSTSQPGGATMTLRPPRRRHAMGTNTVIVLRSGLSLTSVMPPAVQCSRAAGGPRSRWRCPRPAI